MRISSPARFITGLAAAAALFGCERPPETLTHCADTVYTFGSTRTDPPGHPIRHALVLITRDDVDSVLDLSDGSITPLHQRGDLVSFAIDTARPIVHERREKSLRFFDWSARPPREIELFDIPRAQRAVLSPSGDRIAVTRQTDGENDEVLIWNIGSGEIEATFDDMGFVYRLDWRDDAMLAIKTVGQACAFATRDDRGWHERPDLAIKEMEGRLTECFLGDHVVTRNGTELNLPGDRRIHGCHLMDAIRLDDSHIVVACDAAAVVYTGNAELARFEPPMPMAALAVRVAPPGWRLAYAMEGAVWEIPIDDAFQWGTPVRIATLPAGIEFRKKRD
jgi:hypothetical protein